jgi:hypothetical protein
MFQLCFACKEDVLTKRLKLVEVTRQAHDHFIHIGAEYLWTYITLALVVRASCITYLLQPLARLSWRVRLNELKLEQRTRHNYRHVRRLAMAWWANDAEARMNERIGHVIGWGHTHNYAQVRFRCRGVFSRWV